MSNMPSSSVEAITPSELSNKKESILADAILKGNFKFNEHGQLEFTVARNSGEPIAQLHDRTHSVSEVLLAGVETKSAMNILDNKITILKPSANIISILKELHIRVDNKPFQSLENVGGSLQEENIKNIIDLAKWQRDNRVAVV